MQGNKNYGFFEHLKTFINCIWYWMPKVNAILWEQLICLNYDPEF